MAVTVERGADRGANRYKYDCGECNSADGWAQVDTKQDASYFGTWTNPFLLQIFCYCEGDISRTRCDTAPEYVAELRRHKEWNDTAGWGMKIDGMCSPTLISKFEALGLADLLH